MPEPTPVPVATVAGSVSVDALWKALWTDISEGVQREHAKRHRHVIEAAIRAEAPAPSMPSMPPAVGLDVGGLLPYLRHMATCALQAVRDNAPWDPLCDCGLSEEYDARLAPAVAPVGDGLATEDAPPRDVVWETVAAAAPALLPVLPPPDPTLIGTEYKPISIDGGKHRPPLADEVRLLRERFPEVVAFIEHEALAAALAATEDPDRAG